MNKLYALILGVCVAMAGVPAHAQVSTNPNNTIVRFDIFTGGTNLGNIEVELFDEDKPETVRNFLLYVYSGNYSNLLVQRVETNFVLQAGSRIVPKPGTTDKFDKYVSTKNFGRVTNEYSVGPTLSNVFGTIAMARVGGQTNSATSDFFFNLNDNLFLDGVDGGFTTFGRVINTSGAYSGTNLLSYFRSFTNISQICFFELFGQCFDGLEQLPVATLRYSYTTNFTTNGTEVTETIVTNQLPIQVRDAFTMRASVVRGAPRDRVRPKFAVVAPSAKVRIVTNAALNFQGTATDNQEVARVFYDVGSGNTILEGTTEWNHQFTLGPGTNRIKFSTIDWFGNESKPITKTIFYKVPRELSLTNSGAGTVIGATNKQMFDVGRNYTVTAKPARGNFFLGWEGTVTSPFSRITFRMQEEMVLRATFVTNPFPRLRGSYVGLMIPRTPNSGAHVAGMITMNVGPKGIYGGRLQTLGTTFPIRGFFNLGNTTAIGGSRGNSPLHLGLAIATNGPASIRGEYVDGTEVADVQLYRFERATDTVPQAGHFTFTLSPQNFSAIGDGFGIGTVDVSDSAEVTVNGTRQDSVDFADETKMYSGGHFPLFMRWSSQEALLGWMAFATNNNTFEGDVRWISPVFTNFFGEAGRVTGSRFTAPATGEPLLSWTNGSVLLSGDDLDEPIEVPVSLEGGAVTIEANGVDLQLTPESDGRLSGSFVHPGSQTVTPIRGVFLQQSNIAAGFFPGTNRSGAMRLRSTE